MGRRSAQRRLGAAARNGRGPARLPAAGRLHATLQPTATAAVAVANIDGIRALAVAADGATYVATATSVWRMR
ncbi:MAG: hypothetical protein JF613_05810 [Acidobacteria bacterium]|nr:hypothetical protein [Acidobacteriota bacterium]